jgi:hypothetical protein
MLNCTGRGLKAKSFPNAWAALSPLRVLPLRSGAPIFLQGARPRFPATGQVAEVSEIRVIPEYELVIDMAAPKE